MCTVIRMFSQKLSYKELIASFIDIYGEWHDHCDSQSICYFNVYKLYAK